MKRMPKKIIDVLDKYKHSDFIDPEEINSEDWGYISGQIERLYDGFLDDSAILSLFIVSEPNGEYQGDGQYCDQGRRGYSEDCFQGFYYFPITTGEYLSVEYEC